ncbi:MAG: glutamine synthetase family protein [Candidatus Bathyarchaeota archaeon]|nr:glutamine synthetase family protein [Candidatus Bathyarchaeota archaeon]MDH5495583.1 glutamine synthetase family protein [Candidatus Bathyarchaeota archaeon]
MEMQCFTEEGAIKLIQEKDIKIVNLCHIPEDCRLKTLSFMVKNKERLHEILEFGERVDGSSLFSYIDPNKSDVYIMPKTESAFVDPFSSTPTLNILCKYLDENGKPLDVAPENILLRAEEKLRSSTSIILKAFAELEFYIVCKREETVFSRITKRNYHESAPFAKFENLRNEALIALEDVGIATKYGHSEVGGFYSKTGHVMEQHEIEFLPQNLKKMAETITVAKWVIRNICAKCGVSVSFAPKPALEHAGNGMHIHLCGLRGNKNIIADSKGKLTTEAKQMMGGLLKFAPSLTAFGNTIPVSYLRFISREESPMHICWGTKNRLALVRIPLWWNFKKNFREAGSCRRTFEFRAPDSSASTYLLLAGIAVAVEYGLKNPKKSIKIAENLNADNMVRKNRKYGVLPLSCVEAANNLKRDRKYYEANGVFPRRVIDGIIGKLESYRDSELWKKLAGKPEKIEELLWKYLHYG